MPEGSAAEYAAAYERAQRDATDAEATVGALRERLHAAEREGEALTAQTAALGRALDVRNAAAELVARGGSGIRGLLGDAVKVTPGYEAAIAAALGPLAEGVLVETREDAFAVARTGAGRATSGVVDIAIAEAVRRCPAFPTLTGVVPARDVVTAPDGVLGILSHRRRRRRPRCRSGRRCGAGRARSSAVRSRSSPARARSCTEHTLRAGSGRGARGSSSRRSGMPRPSAATRSSSSPTRCARRSPTRVRALDAARQRTKAALTTLREHDAALAAHAEQVNRATVRHEAAIAECERLAAGLAQASGGRRGGRGVGARARTTN